MQLIAKVLKNPKYCRRRGNDCGLPRDHRCCILDPSTNFRKAGVLQMMKMLLSRQSPASPQQLIIHALLLIAAFITLFPFYWMVITSFKTPNEVFTSVFHWLPQVWNGTENYLAAVSKAPIFTFMRNGLIVCFGVLTCQLLVAIPTGWALARYDFRGKKLLFLIVLLGLAVPIQAPAIPLFIALATFVSA